MPDRTDDLVARTCIWAIKDTLSAAASQAIRAADLFDGTDMAIRFHDLATALNDFHNSPQMLGVVQAALRGLSGKES